MFFFWTDSSLLYLSIMHAYRVKVVLKVFFIVPCVKLTLIFVNYFCYPSCLQCVDNIGWVTGRAYSL